MVIRLDENFGDTPLSTKDTKSTNVKSPSTIWAAGGQAQVAALSLAKESGADWGWGQNHVTFQHGFEIFGPTHILEVKHSTRSLPIGSMVIV